MSASQWPLVCSQIVPRPHTVNCSLLWRQHIQLWDNSLLSESPFKKVIIAQDVFYQKVKNQFKNITSSAYLTHNASLFHQISMCSVKKSNNTNETTSYYKGKTWVDILCLKASWHCHSFSSKVLCLISFLGVYLWEIKRPTFSVSINQCQLKQPAESYPVHTMIFTGARKERTCKINQFHKEMYARFIGDIAQQWHLAVIRF